MKLKRNQTFETNSSSCHSLTVADSGELLDTLYPDSDGIIRLTGGEFGWEYCEYNDPSTKANYTAVLLLTMNETWMHESIKSLYPECMQNFIDVIKEQTGCKDVEFLCKLGWDDDNEYPAYIDHQSAENSSDFNWMLNKETIRQFIFNPNSILITDNDN